MAEVSDEPAAASSVAGPAVLAGIVLLFAHAAASALLTVVVSTATPGAGAAGRWHPLVWLVALAAAALALRPVLRRVAKPLATGGLAGLLAAAAYTALSLGFAGAGQATPLLWARAATIVGAGAAAGLLSRRVAEPGAD